MQTLSNNSISISIWKIFILLSFIFFFSSTFFSQVLINADVQINGFRHNHDCGNDAGGFNSQPDPRYRVWIGYNSASFNQVTSAPGLYPGCGDTYGADAVNCSTWNPGIINAATFTALPLSQINVDMESWEEDGCGSNCGSNTCTFNDDDTRCGRLRIGDINFWNNSPCSSTTYNGQFTSGDFLSMHNRCSDNNGRGYGIERLIVNWSFASAPTIISEPFPYDRVLCPGQPTTLTVAVNSWNGWSLGQIVQWQVSSNTDCNSPGTWTNIPGASSLTYTPPQTAGTRLYRCIISSHCSNINIQQTISQCVRVTYHPYAAPIISNACAAVTVPGVPVQFCATLPPNPNASVSNSGYLWTVTPTGGVVISNPTTPCTDITFTGSGSYTISLTYNDACPDANATSTCTTTISPPSCEMIYVDAATGNNANLGLPASPVANLWRAMQLFGGGRTNIRMTGGNYTEPNIIYLQNNVFIEGSWLNNAGVWSKQSNQVTTLNFSGEETLSTSVNHKVGFKATGISGWRIQDLTINTTNNSGTASDGRGKSNYGVLVDNCSNYTVNRCAINVGTATNGGNGGNGTSGSNGINGSIGQAGHCDNNTTNRLGGAGGGAVGSGINLGGAGGAGGRGSDNNSSNNTAGSNGSNGGGGATGGNNAGGTGANGGCGDDSNRDGRKGQDGANGTNGANASVVTAVTNLTFNNYWIPNGAALSGGDGGGGGGAEGGGGGGRQSGFWCNDGGGSGGGGGGSGGQGGIGGQGGFGGGGAFGIYSFNSNTGALVQDITINVPGIAPSGGAPGIGGTGGNGGAGGCGAGGNNTSTTSGGALGSNGGLCGTGRVCGNSEVGAGGQGGRGGNGGNGGNGQPGASGLNVHMVVNGVFSNPSTSVPNPTTINLSHPVSGKGCSNSEVVLSNVNPATWSLPNSTLVDYVNLGVTNYTLNSNPIIVYYASAGFHDVGTNGGIYQDWLAIVDGTRPANANFTNTSSTVCSGSNFTIGANPWGTETNWEWVLFDTDATNPISTQTTQTATYTMPTVSTSTTYNIRYRVKESCCGWSKPYYTTITVVPVTTPLIAATNSVICAGETVILSTTGGGTYLWSDGQTTASIPVNTPGTYTVEVTDLNGCTSSSAPITITLNNATPPLVSAGGSSIICPPASVTLQSTPANSYLWSNGQTTQSIVVTTPGVYDVQIVDLNGCDASSGTFLVSELIAQITASGSSTICQGDAIVLSANTPYLVPTATFAWSLNGTPIPGATSSTYSAMQTGSYTVAVSNGICNQVSAAVQITVYESTITSTNNATTLCPGSTLTLTANTATSYQWLLNGVNIPGETNQTITITQGGTYSVSTSDGTCSAISSDFVITEIVPTITSTGGTTTLCPGTTLTLTSSVGVSYQWQLNGVNIAGATNLTYDVTQGGSYTVIVNDGACTSTSVAFVITEIVPTITSAGGTNQLCPGSTLTLTSSVGISYQWQLNGTNIAGATNQTFDVTQGGSYTVIVTDAVNTTCISTSVAFVITEIVPTITSATGSGILCPGSFLTLTTSTATSYQWLLNGNPIAGAINQTYDATVAGDYSVTTVISGCTSISTLFTVTELIPTISSTGGTTTLCPGSTLTLTSSLGTSYQWQLDGANINGAINQTYDATQEGVYTVIVTDGGCTSTSVGFTITEIIPTISSAGSSTTLCPGTTLTLTSSVGVSYQWQLNGTNIAGATNQTYDITQGGSYTVIVNDGACTSTSVAFVITEIVPTITSAGGTNQLCPGSTLTLTSSPGISYQWQLNGTNIAGATNQTYDVTQGGSYTVIVTDAVNTSCTSTSVAFVITEIVPTITSTGGATTLCPGLTLVLTASTADSYQWLFIGNPIAGETNQTIAVTQPGDYSVTTTVTGCTSTSILFTITELIPAITSTGSATTLCPGSTLTLTASAGTSYQWQLNGTNIANATSQTYDITQGGSYTVIVTSGTCTSTSTAFVVTDIIPTITSAGSATTLCPGSSLVLTSSVGTTYQWQLNGTNIAGATNQTYTVTQGGSYTVIVSDAVNTSCTSTSVAFVITEIVPTITSAGGATTICPGTNLVLTSSPGTAYQWLLNGTNIPGATNQTYTATQGGSYSVSVTSGTCTSTSVVFVLTPLTPTITSAGGVNVICSNTSLVLTSSAGTSYQWQVNGSNIFGATNQTYTASAAGTYSVTVTNGTCTSTSANFVITLFTPVISTTNNVTTICPGTSLPLTVTNGTSYQWLLNGVAIPNATANTYSATQAGLYTVQVGNGTCVSTTAAFVITVFTPTFTAANNINTICPGASIVLTASTGASYQWQLNGTAIAGATNQTYSATQAGTYSVSVSNGNCSVTAANFVITNFTPTISSTGGVTTICQGQSTLLTATAGATYQWLLNGTAIPGETAATITASQAGVYTVAVSNGLCSVTSAAFTLSLFTPTISSAGGVTAICQGGSLTLTASNGTAYQWQFNGVNIPGATNASLAATQAGSYTVSVSNGTCSSTSIATVLTIAATETPVISISSTTGCAPLNFNLIAPNTLSQVVWSIDNTPIGNSSTLNYTLSQPGCYEVTLSGIGSNGCPATATQTSAICVSPAPNAFFTMNPNRFSQVVETVTFSNGSTGGNSYFWDFGDGSTSVEENPSHTFGNNNNGHTVTLTVTSALGCTDVYSVFIPFKEDGVVLYVPNTFTPDGDENNQVFTPVFTSGFDPYSYEITIYNRWGETVWVSNDASVGWDGTYGLGGRDAQQGVYTWKITYKEIETDKRGIVTGHVLLIR